LFGGIVLQQPWAIVLILIVPMPSFTQTLLEQLDRPYAAFYETAGFSYSSHDAKSLRSMLEHDRDQQLFACQNEEKRLKGQLESAQDGLKELNAASAHDTLPAADARSKLHSRISALQQVLKEKGRECKHTIPSSFETQLAKVHVLRAWPRQREHNIRILEMGNARLRKHGDVDDIGFRKLVEGQEKDVATGQQALRQLSATGQLPAEIQDSAVRNYVQDLGTRLARNSDLKVPLEVRVFDNADTSSIALPGGFLFLTSGLLRACETESELAGVMSQQIAHIAARHATRASKRWMFSKLLVPVTQVATGLLTGGVTNAGAYYGMNYGFQGLGMLVDRTVAGSNEKAQREADQLGIQYAWKAGFDPKGFIAFLDNVSRDAGSERSQTFLATKVPLGERLVDAFTEIQLLPPKENYTVDSPEFRIVKSRLQSVISGTEGRRQR